MGESLYAYCTNCDVKRDSDSGFSTSRENLKNFCSECGEDLSVFSETEYFEYLNEQVDFPAQVTLTVPVRLQNDYSYEIIEQLGIEKLPIENQDEYYIDELLMEVDVVLEIDEDWTYSVVSVET